MKNKARLSPGGLAPLLGLGYLNESPYCEEVPGGMLRAPTSPSPPAGSGHFQMGLTKSHHRFKWFCCCLPEIPSKIRDEPNRQVPRQGFSILVQPRDSAPALCLVCLHRCLLLRLSALFHQCPLMWSACSSISSALSSLPTSGSCSPPPQAS